MEKRKTKLTVTIIVAVAIFVGMASFIMLSDYIFNMFALSTKGDTEYFRWVADRQRVKTVGMLCQAGDMGNTVDSWRKMNGKEISSSVILDVSGNLSDMLGLVEFKRDEIQTVLGVNNGRISLKMIPEYDGSALATVNVLADPRGGSLYAQVPDYRDDLIEMSSVYSKQVWGEHTLKELLSGIVDHADKADSQFYGGIAAYYGQKAGDLTDLVEKASVEKLFTVKYGDEEKKYTRITVKSDDTTFKETIKQYFGQDVKGEIDFYVDKKGYVSGGEIRCTVSATRIAATFFNKPNGADVRVTVNSINAATATLEGSIDDGRLTVKLDMKLEAFVKTLLGIRDDVRLVIDMGLSEDNVLLRAEALLNGKCEGSFSINCDIGTYKGAVITPSDHKAYDFDTLPESEYFDAPALAEYALGIIDGVNEDFVNDYIDTQLYNLFGGAVSINSVREMLNEGTLDMFSGSGPAIGEEPEPEPEQDPVIPGIECVSPEEYVKKRSEYPADNDVFGYSHDYLSGCADIKQYKGIAYAVPVSDGISKEQLEERKQKYLAKYEGVFFENEQTIAVQNGDEVYFDIVPILGGYPMTMYAYDDCYELMGTDQYGEGLDDKILGMHVGEIRDVEATLGDQFGDFAGYTGIFRVTLTSIVRETVPSWTEDFVCGRLKHESLEECEQYLLDQLISEADVSEEAVSATLVNIASDKTVLIPLPEELTNRLRQERYNEMYEQTVELGQSPIQYYLAQDKTVDMLVRDIDDSIALDLFRYCFYATIAGAENVTVTGQEVKEAIDAHMAVYGCSTFDDLMNRITLEEIVDEEIEKRIDRIIYDTAIISYE